MSNQHHRAFGWGRLVVWLLAFNILADIVAVVSTQGQVALLRRVAAGVRVPQEEDHSNDERQRTIGISQVGLYVLTGVAFLVWLTKAYKSLRDLGITSSRFSPGWAVGYWFIPVINLVRPYQIVKEFWIKSAVAAGGPDTAHRVALWWALWIGGGILGRSALSQSFGAKTLPELIRYSQTSISTDIVGIVTGLLAMSIVHGINQHQEEVHSHVRPGTMVGDVNTVSSLNRSE